jgi:Pvc16 N-terminal domain/IPT/TIG domain
MSNPLAIAGVSAVLQRLIDDGLKTDFPPTSVGSFTVSSLPPSRVLTPANGADTNQLNLFLYQVTPNAGWRNAAFPWRDDQGQRLTNPPLALDLHYLLSAYGKERLNAEILLGCAMHALHEAPFLTRDAIRTALSSTAPPGDPLGDMLRALGASGLAEQIEQIKISPQTLNPEEMSKLWTAFQAPYRPTSAYLATVVLIESRRSARPTLPVRDRKLFVMPFQQPTIETVSPQIVLSGAKLTLAGYGLQGQITKVRFGSLTVDPDTLNNDQIEVTVPTGLLAGVNTVQVVHSLDFGTPNEPHRGFASNVAAFMIAPQITTPPPITVAHGSTLTLPVMPPVGRSQRVALLVGDQTISIPDRPATGPATTTNLDFPIPANFPTGKFLLRVNVDGAESPLTIDTDPNSPTCNQYIGPTVTIT